MTTELTNGAGRTDTKLAVVIPVSERCDPVTELYHAYRAAVAQHHPEAEFIYVLDGEFPGVFGTLKALQAEGHPIKIVRTTRRFGVATAMSIGVENTAAERILFLPAYYQVDPPAIAALLVQPSTDVLVVRRWPRSDSRFNRIGTSLFHRLLRGVTGHDYRDVGCGVRLVRREVLREVALYGEQHRFLPILAGQRGFKVREVDLPQSPQDKRLRLYRPGAYLRRVIDLLAVFFVVRFTKRPLRFFGLIGSLMMVAGAVTLAVVITQRLMFGMGLAERPALLLGALLLVLGVQLFAFGLLGELITFIHGRELKEYAVEEAVNFAADAPLEQGQSPSAPDAGAIRDRGGGLSQASSSG